VQAVSTSAQEAVDLKEKWDKHLQRCDALEKDAHTNRRRIVLEHQEEVKKQMQELELKRRADREHGIEQASQHEFPHFHEDDHTNAVDYVKERRRNLREDLDQQVRQKHRGDKSKKCLEEEIALKNRECLEAEIQKETAEKVAKKERERSILTEAWDRSVRMKQVQRAIDSHHMSQVGKVDLADFSTGLRTNVPPLSLPESRSEVSGSAMSSRPPTGAVRRMPLGAAGSLALHREKHGCRGPSSAR
jgi:hypothetical protein